MANLVQHQISAPKTDSERKAVDCFCQLLASERDCRTVGKAFVRAVLALRKETGHGKWIPRLKQLGISYEKVRYWMAKIGGKPTDRHKPGSKKPKRSFVWPMAFEWLEELEGKLKWLTKDDAQAAAFAEELDKLSRKLRRGHAEGVLQRKRPSKSSDTAVAHGGVAHSAGGRR